MRNTNKNSSMIFFIVKLRAHKINIDGGISVCRALAECCSCVVRESVASQRLIICVHLTFPSSINLPCIFRKNYCFKAYFKDEVMGIYKR